MSSGRMRSVVAPRCAHGSCSVRAFPTRIVTRGAPHIMPHTAPPSQQQT
jgi:hypothetical protein